MFTSRVFHPGGKQMASQLKLGNASSTSGTLSARLVPAADSRELGIDRGTVGEYVRRWRAAASKPAISHTGSDVEIVSKPAVIVYRSSKRKTLWPQWFMAF